MKPLRSDQHSAFFKKTLKSLSGSRRVEAQELVQQIQIDKNTNTELEKLLKEYDTRLEETQQKIKDLRSGFLKLSAKKRQETAMKISKLEDNIRGLQKKRRGLGEQKSARQSRANLLLKKLDLLRKQEHKLQELRTRRIEKEEQEKAERQKINVERVKAREEVDKPLEDFITAEKPTEEQTETIKALLKRYPIKSGIYGTRDAENQFSKDYPLLTARRDLPSKLLHEALDKLKETVVLD